MVSHHQFMTELNSRGLDVGGIEAQLRSIARSLIVAGSYQARLISCKAILSAMPCND